MILIYSQIQHIIQPIKCQAKGKLIIGTLFPKGSHSNRENEHLNIQEEIAEEVMYTMIRICTKAQWDTEEGVTNYLQSGQRELPEEVICKLISMDESEDHFEMTKKISCTTVKSVHGSILGYENWKSHSIPLNKHMPRAYFCPEYYVGFLCYEFLCYRKEKSHYPACNDL